MKVWGLIVGHALSAGAATHQGRWIVDSGATVLYVPKLTYNLISISKNTESGKIFSSSDGTCQIPDERQKLVDSGARVSNLYYLDCQTDRQQINAAQNRSQEAKEIIWQRRLSHLGAKTRKS